MQQPVLGSLSESLDEICLQIGMPQALAQVANSRHALRVVHNDVEQVAYADVAHRLVDVVRQPRLPLIPRLRHQNMSRQ